MSLTKKMVKNKEEFKDFSEEMKSTITSYPAIIGKLSEFVKDLKDNSKNITNYRAGSNFGSITQQEYTNVLKLLEKMQSSAISKSDEGIKDGIKSLQDSIKGYNTNDPKEFSRFLKSSIKEIYTEIKGIPSSKSDFNDLIDMLNNANEVANLIKKSNSASGSSVLANSIFARNHRIKKANSKIEEDIKKLDQAKVDSITNMISKYYKLYIQVQILKNAYSMLAQTGSSAKASLYINNIKKTDADSLIPKDMKINDNKDKSTSKAGQSTSSNNANTNTTNNGNVSNAVVTDKTWYDSTIKYIKFNKGAAEKISDLSKKNNINYNKGLNDMSLTAEQRFDVWRVLFQNWYENEYPNEKKKFDSLLKANSQNMQADISQIRINPSDIDTISKSPDRNKAIELMKKAVAITILERQMANKNLDAKLLTAIVNAVKSNDYSEKKDKDIWDDIFKRYIYGITDGKTNLNMPPPPI